MKNIHEIFNRFHRFQKIMVVIMIGSLGFLGACSSDDDTTPAPIVDDPSAVTAFNFDDTNTRIAAEIAAAAMEFFPTFNEVSMMMLKILADEAYPPTSPFDLMLCINTDTDSSSLLSWLDKDESGNLTVGDTATLEFKDCDIPDESNETITGTVGFEAVSLTDIPLSIGINVSIDLTITLDPDTTAVAGKFGFTTTTVDMENFTNVYTAVDVPGQTITITENGTPYFKAGCFNVIQTFDSSVVSGMYELDPSGVINAGNQIMSLKDGDALMFVGREMYTGTQRLLSTSEPDECASVGAPSGIPDDSDGTYMDMEAIVSGLMTLHTFYKDGTEFHTEDTSWSALTD